MTARVGKAQPKLSASDFSVGDKVGINHRKINKEDIFTITKINNKNIKVTDSDGAGFTVSPGLLIKK